VFFQQEGPDTLSLLEDKRRKEVLKERNVVGESERVGRMKRGPELSRIELISCLLNSLKVRYKVRTGKEEGRKNNSVA
jgi:hypothetical protein